MFVYLPNTARPPNGLHTRAQGPVGMRVLSSWPPAALGGVGQRGVLRSQSPLGGQTDLYLSSWRLYLGAPQPKYRGVRQESPRVMGCGSSLCLLSLAKRPDGGTWMYHESLPPVPLHLSWVPNIDDLHPCQENTQSTDQQRQEPAMHAGQVASSLLAFVNVKELAGKCQKLRERTITPYHPFLPSAAPGLG